MSNAAYWRKRAALLMYDRMESAEEISAEIAEIYRTAYNEIAYELSEIYGAFGRKYHLSEHEAMRILNTLKDPTDIAALKKALETAGTEEALKIRAALDAPETQRKLRRLQELQTKINDISRDVYHKDLSAQKRWYTQLGYDTYYKTIFDVQREAGFGFSFAHIDHSLIERIMYSEWGGATFSERLWSNISGVTAEVRKQLVLGLVCGKTEKKMAEEIANKYAVGAYESRRLVRTESCYLSNEIQFEAYEECGAERYMYIATLDSRTDEECGALDRRIFEIKDKEPGVNCPPMHPFCRCSTKIYIDQATRDDMKRRARDPQTGRNKIVNANITWREWARDNNINLNARGQVTGAGNKKG